jgi:hypothetical protein
MSITNQTTSLDGMVLYYPMIEVWSGTVKVSREQDLAAAKANLPPATIVSDGRKRLISQKPLRPFLAVRKCVERLLGSHGIRLLGGYAVPVSATAEIEAQLPELEREFLEARADLVSNLDRHFDDWVAEMEEEFPGWGDMLRRNRTDPLTVESRCCFHVGCIRAETPDATTSAGAASRFHAIANSALPTLLQETADRADELLTEFQGKVSTTQRAVTAVRKLVDKLGTFSFLDQRVRPMVEVLEGQLNLLPKTGPLNANATTMLFWVVRQLADPQAMLDHGEGQVTATMGLPVSIGEFDLLSGVPAAIDEDLEETESVPDSTPAQVTPASSVDLSDALFDVAF